MNNYSEKYRIYIEKYKHLHQDGVTYNNIPPDKTFTGTTVLRYLPLINSICSNKIIKSGLDYGCGKAYPYIKGKCKINWKNKQYNCLQSLLNVNFDLYDPGYHKYSNLPSKKRYDLVVCSDVLEHCPTDDLENIVTSLFQYTQKYLFCAVTTFPALKHFEDGENVHISTNSVNWWVNLFTDVGKQFPKQLFMLVVNGKCNDKLRRFIFQAL